LGLNKDSIEYIERITKPVIPILHHNDAKDFKQFQNYQNYADLPDSYTNLLFKLKLDNSKLKKTIKKLSDSNNSIHFLHELVVGYSLNEYCKKNSLELEYSPKCNYSREKTAATPDWIVYDRNQKILIEIVTTDKSNRQSALNACIGLIHSLAKEGLKSNGMDINLDFNSSRFEMPTYQEGLKKEEKAKQEDRFTDFCRVVSDRIITKVMFGYGIDEYETDDSGLEFKIGSGGSSHMTTRGHKTYRVVNNILSKGKAYKELSKHIPIIVAVANNHENRSEAYSPKEIAKLLYYPETVYEPQFSRISDKEQHIKNIQECLEGLNVLEGILFYDINVSSIYATSYEYYPNPHKNTEWKIPDGFKAYLYGSSNENKP